MIRNAFIILSILFSFTISAQQSQPNILLIIADDLGIDAINGFMPSDNLPSTPNIDALRSEGLTFTNTWATPQCTPTRAAIMSGKYGIKTGVMRPPGNLDLEHKSIFTKLRENGSPYANAVIGKWHISNPADYNHPSQHGVDHYVGLFTAEVEDYFAWDKVENESLVTSNTYVTTDLTNASISWISEQDQPWFLWLAHVAPHRPFHIPPEELYSQTNTSSQQQKYFAAIEAMDNEIGRLLENIDDEQLNNTVIIFIGDNGTPSPVIQNFTADHAKSSLYEGGIRVPMIVTGKSISRKGETETALTHVADIHATILEISGILQPGGDYNSLSLKSTLSCDEGNGRQYLYTDYENGNSLDYAIRNDRYKLITYSDGSEELYDVVADILEENNLISQLTVEQAEIVEILEAEAQSIREGWSCNDGIQNGDEEGIDACDNDCDEMDVLSTENIDCCAVPEEPSVYYEYVENEVRNIYTNDFPNHNYCFNPNLQPDETYYNFGISANPSLASEVTLMVRPNGRPARYFGVAKNGVLMAPAPAQPFIFENPNTGEYNWDWVFEPTNNQGNGMELVALDCASAHTGPQGYHYHGDMYEYMEQEYPGITVTTDIPEVPIHIGWASDGHPILYRFGPDADGNIKELLPSYQLKSGLRPGTGIEEPCGPYTGKYTNDYEYICGKGSLDECNGIESQVTVATALGMETFEYFYVITSTFPQIPRCIVGEPSQDFESGSSPLNGVDADNDGFLSQFDCDDTDPMINPLAVEIPGNDIDENCDGILTSSTNIDQPAIQIGPNPSNGNFTVTAETNNSITASLLTLTGELVLKHKEFKTVVFSAVPKGVYLLAIQLDGKTVQIQKIVVY